MDHMDGAPIAEIRSFDAGPFDITRFWQGEPVDPRELEKVRLWAQRDGPLEDYFSSPVSWHIISDRFATLLGEAVTNDAYELVSAPVYDAATKEPLPGYRILNVLEKVECLDIERSGAQLGESGDWFTFNPYLLKSKIPESARLFRVREYLMLTVFRGDLVAKYLERGFTGAWFRHLPTENEEYIDTE